MFALTMKKLPGWRIAVQYGQVLIDKEQRKGNRIEPWRK